MLFVCCCLLFRLEGHQGAISALNFSPCHQHVLVTAAEDRTFKVGNDVLVHCAAGAACMPSASKVQVGCSKRASVLQLHFTKYLLQAMWLLVSSLPLLQSGQLCHLVASNGCSCRCGICRQGRCCTSRASWVLLCPRAWPWMLLLPGWQWAAWMAASASLTWHSCQHAGRCR